MLISGMTSAGTFQSLDAQRVKPLTQQQNN